MLQAIVDLEGSGLGDDVFLEDTTTSGLEAFIADLTGCRAALLVMSGTMGNQLSIRTHLQGPPHSVVADSRSHIMGWWVTRPYRRTYYNFKFSKWHPQDIAKTSDVGKPVDLPVSLTHLPSLFLLPTITTSHSQTSRSIPLLAKTSTPARPVWSVSRIHLPAQFSLSRTQAPSRLGQESKAHP